MTKENRATDPADISTLRAEAEVFYPGNISDLIEKLGSWNRLDVSCKNGLSGAFEKQF